MAPLESSFATFQGSSQQREKRSHRTHIDTREHEPGLFRLQIGPLVNGSCQELRSLSGAIPLQEELGMLRATLTLPWACARKICCSHGAGCGGKECSSCEHKTSRFIIPGPTVS